MTTDRELMQQALFIISHLRREHTDDEAYAIEEALRARLAQPELQQRTGDCLLTGVCASEGHRIQKAQREWQGLTDEDVSELEQHYLFGGNEFGDHIGYWAVYRAIEAKLKEKNNG